MSALCGTCNESLPSDGGFVTCSVCREGYHYSPCCSLSEVSWRTYGDRRNSWKCSVCKSTVTTKGSNLDRNKSEGDDSELEDDRTAMLVARVMQKKIASLESKLDKRFNELQHSLTFYGEKLEEMAKTVKGLEQRNVLLEKKLTSQEAATTELKTKVKQLEVMVQQRDQRDNSTKLEVTGFKNYDVDEKKFMLELLDKTGYSPQGNVVQYRVNKVSKPDTKNKSEKNISLVIQFTSEEMRSNVLAKVKENMIYNKMDIVVQGKCSNLGFNEYLTPYYKKLYYEAKRVAMDKKYAFLWVKYGKILLKKTPQSKIDTLACMDDLAKL